MQSKICVLQVIPNLDVSGASQGCVDVANFLSEKNYNSYILTHSGPKTSDVKDYNEKVLWSGQFLWLAQTIRPEVSRNTCRHGYE